MSSTVLGRDPFSRPAEPPPEFNKPLTVESEKPPRSEARPQKRNSPATTKKAAVRKESQAEPARDASPPLGLEAQIAEMDRQELLGHFKNQASRLRKALKTTIRMAQPANPARWMNQIVGRFHSDQVDSFGYDPQYWDTVKPIFEFLMNRYWRTDVCGAVHIPPTGRALLVANHSGAMPYDGLILKLAVEKRHPAHRSLRYFVEDFIFHFPYLGPFINRTGGIRACQDNARRLLQSDLLAAVFPEGIQGSGKLYRDRYRLRRFGRGGFIRLALATSSPIIPTAIVGGEETHPVLSRMGWLAKPMGLPFLPITPTFPWLGPLGLLPLPSKWMIRFGEPIILPPADQVDMDDPIRINELSEQVREAIQHMLDDMLYVRGNPFWGNRVECLDGTLGA